MKYAIIFVLFFNVQIGETLYWKHCINCHGIPVSRSEIPDFIPSLTLHSSKLAENEMVEVVRHGRRNTLMPHWSPYLSDYQILSIVKWLKGF